MGTELELELELILSRWLWEREEKGGASLQKQARVRALCGVMQWLRGSFEVCLLIIFHVFGALLFVCFIAGVSPLLIPPMRTPSRGVTCRSRGRISECESETSRTDDTIL